MVDGDIVRVEKKLRRAAIAAIVILSNQRRTRTTTLRALQGFDMLGYTGYKLC